MDLKHSPRQNFQRRKKKERRKKALPHNLSRSSQVGPQLAFFQIIITGSSSLFWERGAIRSENFLSAFAIFFCILLNVNDVLSDRRMTKS